MKPSKDLLIAYKNALQKVMTNAIDLYIETYGFGDIDQHLTKEQRKQIQTLQESDPENPIFMGANGWCFEASVGWNCDDENYPELSQVKLLSNTQKIQELRSVIDSDVEYFLDHLPDESDPEDLTWAETRLKEIEQVLKEISE